MCLGWGAYRHELKVFNKEIKSKVQNAECCSSMNAVSEEDDDGYLLFSSFVNNL